MATKVAIHYGIFTGPRVGKQFRRFLANAGYQYCPDPEDADIIICHSAGYMFLSKYPKHQRYMLINPIYWPSKSIKERGRSRVKTNFLFFKYGHSWHRWLARNFWGIYYGIVDLPRTRYIIREVENCALGDKLGDHKVFLVRNEHDDWLTPDLLPLAKSHPNLQIILVPGEHDDCWYNPEPYVALLKRLQDW